MIFVSILITQNKTRSVKASEFFHILLQQKTSKKRPSSVKRFFSQLKISQNSIWDFFKKKLEKPIRAKNTQNVTR